MEQEIETFLRCIQRISCNLNSRSNQDYYYFLANTSHIEEGSSGREVDQFEEYQLNSNQKWR